MCKFLDRLGLNLYCQNSAVVLFLLSPHVLSLTVRTGQVQELQLQLVEKIQRINSLEDNQAMLREQVQTFREDFESERRDREKAQCRIASLESELAAAKQQVE